MLVMFAFPISNIKCVPCIFDANNQLVKKGDEEEVWFDCCRMDMGFTLTEA